MSEIESPDSLWLLCYSDDSCVFVCLCERPSWLFAPTQARSLYICFLSDSGSIVSVGDPKKKYTRFEKIGQG